VLRKGVAAIDHGLYAAVSVLVVALLLGMVLLSFAQVMLRNLLGGGIAWADVVLRHLVLAVGMFGAVLATRQGRQISIDVFSRIVGPGVRIVLGWIVGLFTILICMLMARAALVFVSSEKAFGSELGSGLPSWPFEIVIPLGFALIAFQVVLNLLLGRRTGETAGVKLPVSHGVEIAGEEKDLSKETQNAENVNSESDTIRPVHGDQEEENEEGKR
jgi:TRAP-type C4-dicarboxylate transport system permease small subunit